IHSNNLNLQLQYSSGMGMAGGTLLNGWKGAVLKDWTITNSLNILYVPIGLQYWTGVPYGFAPGFQGVNAATAPFNWDRGYPGVFVPGTKSSTMPIDILGTTISPDSLLFECIGGEVLPMAVQ
ncbi:MAG TPA: hypothetical protein VIX37_10885, partial [Candidatus Sulfotelmatobacter sp.]